MTHHFAQRRPREAQETIPWTVGKQPVVWNFLGTNPEVITRKEVEPGDFALNETEDLWVWTGLSWQDVSSSRNTVEKNVDYTVLGTDGLVLVNADVDSLVLTLPSTASNSGKLYYIKKIDSSNNTVTIDGAGTELIDDAETAVLTVQYESVTLVSDGTAWWIV